MTTVWRLISNKQYLAIISEFIVIIIIDLLRPMAAGETVK